jgi:hypothetical protein
MWKKLFAAVTGLGLTAGAVRAGDPLFSNSGFFDVEQPATSQPGSSQQPTQNRYPFWRWLRPTTSTRPSSLEEDGFRGSVFETQTYPLSQTGSGVVRTSGQGPRITMLPDVVAPETPVPNTTPTVSPKLNTPAGTLLLADGSLLVPSGTTPDGETIYEAVPANRVKIDPVKTPSWRVWGSAEVLLGMTRHVNTPPLVTTGPSSAGVGTAGALGQSSTVPLFGGDGLLDGWRAGVRAELGAWFDNSHTWGAEFRFYSLYSTSDQFAVQGNGNTVVNLPQFTTFGPGAVQFPIYASFPGLFAGSVAANAQTSFSGGDLSLRRSLGQSSLGRFDMLFGYRQLHLGDVVGDDFNITTPLLTGAAATNLLGNDSVRSRNNFYGGQLGGVYTVTRKRLSLEGLVAVALGVNVSDLDFDRTRQLNVGTVASIPLVQTSIADRATYFGVATEGGVKVGYQLTDHVKLTFGYTGLYWWNLRRAQEQYTLSPTLTGRTTYFYTHMFSWGAEFRF